jgi:hypothetical protein
MTPITDQMRAHNDMTGHAADILTMRKDDLDRVRDWLMSAISVEQCSMVYCSTDKLSLHRLRIDMATDLIDQLSPEKYLQFNK